MQEIDAQLMGVYRLSCDRTIVDRKFSDLMKGDYTLKVLQAIKESGKFTADLFEAFLKSGYGASIRRMEYEFEKLQKERKKEIAHNDYKKKYSDLLYRLKRDKLIEISDKDKKDIFALTDKGKRKLKSLQEKDCQRLPNYNSYEQEQGDRFIIVIFDIPEKEKRKRNWLRFVLKRLDLKMIQKSVWIGKVKIPQILLQDLLELKLLDYVEIFEISRNGGLKHLI